MSDGIQLSLKPTSIMEVPLQVYEDFTFVTLESKYVDIYNKELEIVNDENIFERFHQRIQHPNLYSKYIQQEAVYLAANFYNFINDESIASKLTIEELDRVLRNPKLQIESEDQLLKFLCKLYQNDDSYSSLFQHVHFRSVSQDEINEFLEIFNTEFLTKEIWYALSFRTAYGYSNSGENELRYHKKQEFNYSKFSSSFNGILNYIRSKMPNNIFKEIEISSSSLYLYDEQYSPQNAIFL